MAPQDDGREEGAGLAHKLLSSALILYLTLPQWDGEEDEGRPYHHFAVLCLIAYGFFTARASWQMGKTERANEAAEAQRRLNIALTLPDSGVTQEWYETAGRGIDKIRMMGYIIAAIIFVALLGASYPRAAFDWIGEQLQAKWEHLLDNYTHTQIAVGVYAVAHVGVFWILSIPNLVIDIWRPKVLEPFRIWPDFQITKQDIIKATAVALFNQFLTLLPHLYGTHLAERMVPGLLARELPSFAQLVYCQVGIMCISEPFFYFTHRFLHTEWAFKHIHSMHHSIMKPTSLQSIYAHPLEHLFSVTPFFIGGCLLFRAHIALWLIWYANRTFQSCYAHCSLSFPLIASNMFHSYHHEEVAGPEGYQNYGFNSGFLDIYCGSTQYYRQHTWQARIDKRYNDQSMPIDRALARAGLLPAESTSGTPEVGSAKKQAPDDVEAPLKVPADTP